MQPQSLYQAAALAAQSHAQQVASRLGPEHAAAARVEWNRDRFWLWAIERALEHVEGHRFWPECARRNFARVQQSAALALSAKRVRELLSRLGSESLPSFRAKESLIDQLAAEANQLLD